MIEPTIVPSGGPFDRPEETGLARPADGAQGPPKHPLTRRDLLLGAGVLFGAVGAGKWLWEDAERFHRGRCIDKRRCRRSTLGWNMALSPMSRA